MNICSVCSDAHAREIDDLVRSGSRSTRSIATAFGVGYEALKRHVRNHVDPRRATTSHGTQDGAGTRNDAPANFSTPTADPGAPVDLADELRASLRAIDAQLADERLSHAGRVTLLNQKRLTIADLAVLEPAERPAEATVLEVDGLPEFLADLRLLLDAHAGIRDEVASLWRAHRISTTTGSEAKGGAQR